MKNNTLLYEELSFSRDGVAWREIPSLQDESNKLECNNFPSCLSEIRTVATRLRDARLARGYSLDVFARALGVARTEALAWETSERCPSFWLRKASELLDADYEWLAYGRASVAYDNAISRDPFEILRLGDTTSAQFILE